MTTNAGAVVVDNNHADMQILKASEASTLQTDAQTAGLINAGGVSGENLLEYGYVVRNASGRRSIPAASTNNSLSVSLRVPQTGDAGNSNTIYRYSMTFLVFTDTVTRVTESIEEQGTTNAATRAGALGGSPQIAFMCGSSRSANLFLPAIKTAGDVAPTAWMGGNFRINEIAPAANFTFNGNTQKNSNTAQGLISNRYTALGGATLTANGSSLSAQGSNVVINTNGSFSFDPKLGFTGSDNFNYTVSDGTCTSPSQTANATVSNMSWYVKNNTAAGGTGRKSAPFNQLSSGIATASPGQIVFVFAGTGDATNQNTGFSLKNNLQLSGEGANFIVGGDTIVAAGTAPVIGNSGGTGITLGQNNTIVGINVNASATGISGSSFGSLTADKLNVTGKPALNLSNADLAVRLTSLNSNGATNGLVLLNTTGFFNVTGDGATVGSGGTVQNTTGEGILLSNPGSVALGFMNIKNSALNNIKMTSSSGVQALRLEKTVSENAGNGSTTVFVDGLNWNGSGSSVTNITLTGATIQNNTRQGLDLTTEVAASSSAVLNLNVSGGSVFKSNAGQNIFLFFQNSGNSTYSIQNNTFDPSTVGNSGVTVNMTTTSTTAVVQGRVNNNTVNLFSGGAGNGIGISTGDQAHMVVEILGNTISNYGTFGIDLIGGGANSRLSSTVKNNTITSPGGFGLEGMRLVGGNTTGATSQLCTHLQTNSSIGSASNPDGYVLRMRPGNTFQLEGLTTNGTVLANVKSFVEGTNNPAGTVTARIAPATATVSVNYTNATCATPSF